MSTNSFAAILFLLSTLSFSQTPKDGKIFLDSTWNETTEANHKYYRIVKDYYSDKESYKIYDYFKSGVLQMAGASKFKDRLQKEGQFVYYYENGNKESMESYINGSQTGKQYNWYQNGQKKSETEFFIDNNTRYPNYKIIQFWDINGNQKIIDGNGEYETKADNFYETGKIVNGLKHGIWEGVVNSEKYTYTENYVEGNLISGTSTDYNNIKYNYTSITTMPGPKKDIKHFYNFISNNFIQPKEAKLYNVSGTVYLTFIIEKDGRASDIKVVRKVGFGIDEEAIRIVKSYNQWSASKTRGMSRSVMYSLPISIK